MFIGSDKPVNILNDFRIVCFVLALFLPVIPLIIAGIIQIVDVRLQHLQILCTQAIEVICAVSKAHNYCKFIYIFWFRRKVQIENT